MSFQDHRSLRWLHTGWRRLSHWANEQVNCDTARGRVLRWLCAQVPWSNGYVPHSLLRAARTARMRAEGRAWFGRILRQTTAGLHVLRGPVAALLPLMISLTGPWILPGHVGLPALAQAGSAISFLSTIWGVEAVGVALAGSIIIFGFQLFTASRHARSPGSRRAFAEDCGLFLFLGIATSGLLLPGLVLLGYGHGAPGKWAATWGVLVSFAGLLSIPLIFLLALTAADERALDERRNRRLKRLVEMDVQRDILERLALLIVQDKCSALGVTMLGTSFPPIHPGLRTVTAGKAGTVRDVRLRRLQAASREARDIRPQAPEVFLCTRIGATVSADTQVAILPAALPQRHKAEKRIARIGRAL